MVTTSHLIAASSIIAAALGAPIPSQVERSTKSFFGYNVFGGDGTTSQGWPAESDWWSFDDLWAANLDVLKKSCTQYPGSPQNNSPEEIAAIKDAILSVSDETSVPSQYILISMMQESKGCVRAPTTNYGVRNPGLMQSFNGKSTCNEGGFTTPCPASTIKAMVSEGVGVGLAFGIIQAIEQSGAADVSKYYKAARIYNSGSLAKGANLGAGIATHCYSTDIANRLVGWTSEKSACDEATIGSVGGSSTAYQGGNSNDNNTPPKEPAAPAEPSTPEPEPVKPEPVKPEPVKPEPAKPEPVKPEPPVQQEPTKPAPPTDSVEKPTEPETPAPPAGGASPSLEKAPGAAEGCTSWYDVKLGDDCRSTGIAFDLLRSLNTEIDEVCSNLWAGYSYCIAA